MKYVVILGDGMADKPLEQLGGKTPLAYAKTPMMDFLASHGELGMVQTVPLGMKPGSDVANLSVMGYDPASCYSGRSPLEALSVGVSMKDTDIIYRCNLVTVTENEPFPQKTILDHSAGEISTEDADILMDAVRQAFTSDSLHFYTGTSYRHITVWDRGEQLELEPPHDHLGCVIDEFLPENEMLREIMAKSFELLNDHPLNQQRAAEGKNKANCLWFWGAGTKPALEDFSKKTSLQGAVISAVDLLKGIAVGAGMDVVNVPGANGTLDTNYRGKAEAAIQSLLGDGSDFVYIHIEAPDEMGHQGKIDNKVKAIELIDCNVVKVVKDALDDAGCDYRILLLPDHPTPICCRTHTSDPVPYVLFDSTNYKNTGLPYNEEAGRRTGHFEPVGHKLIEKLIG